MTKIKGRENVGLAEAAHTWQFFHSNLGWDVEIWFDAEECVVWAIPLPATSIDGWRIVTCGNYRYWYINPRDVPSDYKGKVAYLKDAIGIALNHYKDCYDVLSSKDER